MAGRFFYGRLKMDIIEYNFGFDNRKKSHSAKSGEKSGWVVVLVALLVLDLVTIEALSSWNIYDFFYHSFSILSRSTLSF